MVRVLVSFSPCMYRESVALAIHRNRPDLDVRISPPGATAEELVGFRPHLLLHDDNAPIPAGALEKISCRVEVLYSDSMNARVYGLGPGSVSEVHDMSTEDLLRVVDAVAARESGDREAEQG